VSQPRLSVDEFDEQREKDLGVCRKFSPTLLEYEKNDVCAAEREQKSRKSSEEQCGGGVVIRARVRDTSSLEMTAI
jgi:hypothetical protein